MQKHRGAFQRRAAFVATVATISALALGSSGCRVVGGIFKAGVGVGIVIVVVLVAIVAGIARAFSHSH
jgi:hypothetical protein